MKVTSKTGVELIHEISPREMTTKEYNIETKKNYPIQFVVQIPSVQMLLWMVKDLKQPLGNCVLIYIANRKDMMRGEVLEDFRFWSEYDYLSERVEKVVSAYKDTHTLCRKAMYIMATSAYIVLEYEQAAPQIDNDILVDAFGEIYKQSGVFKDLNTVEGLATFLAGNSGVEVKEKFLEMLPIYKEAISTTQVSETDKRFLINALKQPKLFFGFIRAVTQEILPDGLRRTWNCSVADKVEEK